MLTPLQSTGATERSLGVLEAYWSQARGHTPRAGSLLSPGSQAGAEAAAPTGEELESLAREASLSPAQVQRWFTRRQTARVVAPVLLEQPVVDEAAAASLEPVQPQEVLARAVIRPPPVSQPPRAAAGAARSGAAARGGVGR